MRNPWRSDRLFGVYLRLERIDTLKCSKESGLSLGRFEGMQAHEGRAKVQRSGRRTSKGKKVKRASAAAKW